MKLSLKITLIAICPVFLALGVFLVTLLVQQQKLDQQVADNIRKQAFSEAAKVVQGVYWTCASEEDRNQKQLTRNLGIAHELLSKTGKLEFSTNTVSWQAVNQLTKETTGIALPKMMVGNQWLGQVRSLSEPAPVVDEVSHLTGDFCTIFQRMNAAGDMLRICTSVVKEDGARALGTYIPARKPDGSENEVIQTVLRGETFRGRAYVVNQWHSAAYEPIWDAGHQKVIGMLYVGIGMGDMNKDLRDNLANMVVGKTGYVFVLGGTGDERGKYILSYQEKRDGENIWNAKDAAGNLFIQSIIQKALTTQNGKAAYEAYPWKNAGEKDARIKLAAVTYYAPWNWVIGAGAYEDDFAEMRQHTAEVKQSMMLWIGGIAGLVGILAALAGWLISRNIARPIGFVIGQLNNGVNHINSAASQVSAASQTLAEGSSEQAASMEESSASLEELTAMTRNNTENSLKTNALARQAHEAAEKGNADMNAMSTAMQAIKASSDDISKIIKTIDEIAFQTNILALNAAVEAARAGEAGMGFAVVADEVRNLAQRSAQAAKETSTMIEGAISKTEQGVVLSRKVAEMINDILAKVRQVDELAAEVAGSSKVQAAGITQINTAVAQMDRVTQGNAASAEESAAAAEELNGQAEILKQSVTELVKLVGGRAGQSPAKSDAHSSGAVKARSVKSNVSALPGKANSHRQPVAAALSGNKRQMSEIPLEGDFKDF